MTSERKNRQKKKAAGVSPRPRCETLFFYQENIKEKMIESEENHVQCTAAAFRLLFFSFHICLSSCLILPVLSTVKYGLFIILRVFFQAKKTRQGIGFPSAGWNFYPVRLSHSSHFRPKYSRMILISLSQARPLFEEKTV